MDKITTSKLLAMKAAREKIAVLTGYDYSMAKILDEAGIDVILVGDSLGMVKLGYENTLPVTMEDMLYHCRAVKRGNRRAFLAVDMPFLSYETKPQDAVLNAGRLIKEGGAEAVKLEGGKEMVPAVKAIIDAKIPVIGHLGLTPQGVHKFGGYRVQGKTGAAAKKIIADAKALEKAGIFMLVLECVPAALGKTITKMLSIPTISIGAGPYCDGQVLVTDDLLGLYSDNPPRFVKRYASLRKDISGAVKKYREEVKSGKFPAKENTY